jgi:hypothetical protein
MNITNKREMLRNQSHWDDHFLCTNRRVPYGIWLNVERLFSTSPQERQAMIEGIFDQLGLENPS